MSAQASERTNTAPGDVDMDAVPTCEFEEHCKGNHGPAVGRARFEGPCEHVDTLLMCEPCAIDLARHIMSMVELVCRTCGDRHQCLLICHVSVMPL